MLPKVESEPFFPNDLALSSTGFPDQDTSAKADTFPHSTMPGHLCLELSGMHAQDAHGGPLKGRASRETRPPPSPPVVADPAAAVGL